MQQRACILIVVILSPISLTASFAAQDADRRLLEQHLQRPITVAWQGQSLGKVLGRLSETQKFSLWLDRRVDPQQVVEASFSDLSLQQILEQLTEPRSLGICVLENLIYVGPARSAHELATLLQQAHDSVAQARQAVQRRWLKQKSATWPRLSQPRDLLSSMLEQAGLTLVDGNAIAHDLWDSKQLPRLTLVDKTVLILLGFDLTCKISADGGSCQVVPIERPVVLDRQYRISRSRKRLLAELQRLVPKARVEFEGRTLHVTGSWEDQVKVQQTLAGTRLKPPPAKPPSPVGTEKLFSLQLKNQAVGGVINQLAHQLKLQVEWDHKSLDAAKRSQQTLVSCDLKNVPLDELLSGILTPAGLKFRRKGKTIAITPLP